MDDRTMKLLQELSAENKALKQQLAAKPAAATTPAKPALTKTQQRAADAMAAVAALPTDPAARQAWFSELCAAIAKENDFRVHRPEEAKPTEEQTQEETK